MDAPTPGASSDRLPAWSPVPDANRPNFSAPANRDIRMSVFTLVWVIVNCWSFIIVLTGCETQNKYRVCNSVGQQVYFAQESESVGCISLFPRRHCWPSPAVPRIVRRGNSTRAWLLGSSSCCVAQAARSLARFYLQCPRMINNLITSSVRILFL